MATQRPSDTVARPVTLTDADRRTCDQIAQSGETLHGQRARALLALDSGQTVAAAAEAFGLTLGQVRYLVQRYQRAGIGLFPEELWKQDDPEPKPITKSVIPAPDPAAGAPRGGIEPPAEPELAEQEDATADTGKKKKDKKKKDKKGGKKKKKKKSGKKKGKKKKKK